LAAFLKLVEGGQVPQGSFLVIENLDRLSREDIWSALDLVSTLLKAGIRIVQLKPVEQVIDKTSGPIVAMMAIMELSRGHGESAMKSERVGRAWARKKEAARAGAILTRRLPAWVEDRGGTLALIPQRAVVIKRVFALAAAGYGAAGIVRKFTEEKVPRSGPRGTGRAPTWH